MIGRIAAAAGLLLALVLVPTAWAEVPAAYSPIVLQPVGGPQRTEFDLRAALERARREQKSLYVYLGAHDCAFCRRYEAFLRQNASELAPRFTAAYLMVELRSALSVQAPALFLRAGDQALAYVDFQRSIGDERVRQLVYPSVWLLDANGRSLMQMPAGTGTFETVAEQIEILDLVQ